MANKIRLGLIYGGRSAEHEVSVRSARSIMQALDKTKYDVVPIAIDPNGRWLLEDFTKTFLLNADRVELANGTSGSGSLSLVPLSQKGALTLTGADEKRLDVVFPVVHGPFGEDGTIQGLLKLSGIPFVGADVLGSAVGMDKDVMKRLLAHAHIPIPRYVTVSRQDYESLSWRELKNTFGDILFVKPANLGSSIGVSKVKSESEFLPALKLALDYDHKVIVEEFIDGREFWISVLGNETLTASLPGEVVHTHDFYTYEAKYDPEKKANLVVPAVLDSATTQKMQEISMKTFKTLCCQGMARIDLFLRKDGNIFVNEINTIPGLTSKSMYVLTWEASGISYGELLDRLIQLAMDSHQRNLSLSTSYLH